MGQEPVIVNMNPVTSGKASTRDSGYRQKALAEIRNSLLPFANGGGISSNDNYSSAASTISTISTTSGVSSASGLSSNSNGLDRDINLAIRQKLSQLINMGYTEESAVKALKLCNGKCEAAVEILKQSSPSVEMCNGFGKSSNSAALNSKLMRKPSLERELSTHRGSPAVDSGAGSSRSDSPRQLCDILTSHPHLSRQYSPNNFGSEPPPLPPPRNSSTPPPPPPPHGVPAYVPTNMQQMLKRMSPAPGVPSRPPAPPPTCNGNASQTHQRGTSPVPGPRGQPMIVQNGPQVQQQLSQQMQALNLYPNVSASVDPPPPYPIVPPVVVTAVSGAPAPPSYVVSLQTRHSPTQSQPDYRKSPSSGIYSGSASAGSPSPTSNVSFATSSNCNGSPVIRPAPLPGWSARQTKTQPPIIMQSVKSTQVQKPVLQTAIAPTAPSAAPVPPPSTASAQPLQPPPPSYASSIQQKQHTPQCQLSVSQVCSSPQQASLSAGSSVTPPVPTTEPPSYASTMQALAVKRGINMSPYSNEDCGSNSSQLTQCDSTVAPARPPLSGVHPVLQHKFSPSESRSESPASASSAGSRTPPLPPSSSSSSVNNNNNNNNNNNTTSTATATTTSITITTSTTTTNSNNNNNNNNNKNSNSNNNNCATSKCANKNLSNGVNSRKTDKVNHQSPIPERKHMSKEREEERRDCKVRNYSPQAFKFFMEQHIENVEKSYKQRMFRQMQLENEMQKIGLSSEAQLQMRKLLSKKESNYIRLKRAKMDKSMFTNLKPIGIGAFGEVTLVRKIDTNHLYAMKTLRKADVLEKKQVAHVKAERDILAEADNEWVVKLYYSFQDKDNLYFVMDYIPGGDLMSLLIKFGIFEEPLARFYLAELTCAVESVHKMGFIHRDIKPDNILIDRDGHIKLTDFGLCTGFRWTHNSKYYQSNGEHNRQDSLDPNQDWINGADCKCYQKIPDKPLERRRKREQHQRCLAHSLVGTPNYIAPEVLERTGYTQLCDWWSVGVILYEMLVGCPPFRASTPPETQQKIIRWKETLKIPSRANLSAEAADLILKLCTSCDRRLGKNANEVKQHPFFSGINFNEGIRGRLTPPYTPKIHFLEDTSNFDEIDPSQLHSSSNESGRVDDKTFHGFFEFTFRRFFDDGSGGLFPTSQRNSNVDENDNQGAVYV